MAQWIEAHRHILDVVLLVAVVVSSLGLFLVPWAITRIPSTYFLGKRPPALPWANAHPLLKGLLTGIKNVLGAFLLLAGLALVALPGQGLLTMLLGAMLLDFPGKRPMELAFIRKKRVFALLNWMRRRAGREPLVVDEGPPAGTSSPVPDEE